RNPPLGDGPAEPVRSFTTGDRASRRAALHLVALCPVEYLLPDSVSQSRPDLGPGDARLGPRIVGDVAVAIDQQGGPALGVVARPGGEPAAVGIAGADELRPGAVDRGGERLELDEVVAEQDLHRHVAPV